MLCADADELRGRITFMDPYLQTEFAAIELHNVGLVTLQPALTATAFEVELYVERMANFIRRPPTR